MKKSFLEKLLALDVIPESNKIRNRESDCREFKQIFEKGKLWRYAKTMAAFANRDGGAIYFGIRDRPKTIVGVNDELPQDLDLSNFIKENFEPEIKFSIEEKRYSDKRIMIIVVEPSPNKPIICRKDYNFKQTDTDTPKEKVLRQGAIYYRYSSATEEIKYAELKEMLIDQANKIFNNIFNNMKIIKEIGVSRAAIVDANELTQDDGIASVYLTNDTARQLNWIDKGRFVDTPEEGNNAYYVVKKVEIKHGVEIEKLTDYSKTHPLTKTALGKETNLKMHELNAILQEFTLYENPEYHITTKHGKSIFHKFSNTTKNIILEKLPLSMETKARKTYIQEICSKYNRTKIREHDFGTQL